MVRVPSSFPGHNGHGSRGISADSEWPTTTQLRVMGSLRSSIRSIRLVETILRVYTPAQMLGQAAASHQCGIIVDGAGSFCWPKISRSGFS